MVLETNAPSTFQVGDLVTNIYVELSCRLVYRITRIEGKHYIVCGAGCAGNRGSYFLGEREMIKIPEDKLWT